jgi:fused signal recognition particle receptor
MAKNFFSSLFGRNRPDAPGETLGDLVEATQVSEPAAQAAPAPAAETSVAEAPVAKKGFFSRLREGLSRSAGKLGSGVTAIFTKKKLDDRTIEELEELLISADLGVAAAARAATALAKDRFNKEVTDAEVKTALADSIAEALTPLAKPLVVDAARKPHVILVAGVNGSGKTTTIGKLASRFRAEGKSVVLAAGDTFRAAAIEQLKVWGERTGAPVIARDVGADASGLAFDALDAAKKDGADVLMIDTAGRLQNRRELMDELAKIVRVLKKIDPTAPHDVLLVLDATVGQNALQQAEVFRAIAGVTGLVMTKLDGTAKGGVLVALSDKFQIPIHFIGVGESVEDLQPFDARSFARALAGLEDEAAA